jgi:2-polyprenyl-6-methoxyphenol hydroxylase-like FAD-dependent oxidoreductase
MSSATDVLVVGAGPTGLTLAVDLARRGVAVRLVEAAPAPCEGSRGKGIQPRTLEVFHALGVVDAVLAAGAPYPALRLHVGRLSVRAGSLGTRRRPSEAVPYPNLWMVPQARTEAILRKRLVALGGRVEFGRPLIGFAQDGRGVTAELAGGETVWARHLVGCDGGHSAVRKALGLRFGGEALDDRPMLVADVEVEGLDRRDWHVWPLARHGVVALCPLPHTSLFQLTARAAVADEIEGAVRDVTGRRVTRVAWRSVYRPATRVVERLRAGRVFLAGDAAHVHPPAGGQGLNTGVQDAFNLGWKLARALGGAPDTLLDTYEAERLPVAAAVLGLSRRLYRARSLRRGDATNQLALHYRASPLSRGGALGRLRAGDRMPDTRLADGTRLFDRLRGGHALELVTPAGRRVLIRPDGYVAGIVATRVGAYAGAPTTEVRATEVRTTEVRTTEVRGRRDDVESG